MIDRIAHALRRRPVRIVEALIVLAGALGLALDPDAAQSILVLVGLVVGGGEVAQTKTTPVADPKVPSTFTYPEDD